MLSFLLGAGDDAVADPAPTAPPTGPTKSAYGGGFVRVSWSAGDAAASTEIGVVEDGLGGEPTSAYASVGPGVTSYETDLEPYFDADGNPLTIDDRTLRTFWVRHTRGGSETAWVGPAT